MWTTHLKLVVMKESHTGQSFSNLAHGHDQLKHYSVTTKDANLYSS